MLRELKIDPKSDSMLHLLAQCPSLRLNLVHAMSHPLVQGMCRLDLGYLQLNASDMSKHNLWIPTASGTSTPSSCLGIYKYTFVGMCKTIFMRSCLPLSHQVYMLTCRTMAHTHPLHCYAPADMLLCCRACKLVHCSTDTTGLPLLMPEHQLWLP